MLFGMEHFNSEERISALGLGSMEHRGLRRNLITLSKIMWGTDRADRWKLFPRCLKVEMG